MRKVDYIIVGLGIGGLSFAEQLRTRGKSFILIDASQTGATHVAGGVVNPVVLKRLTAVWRAQEFLEEAFPFYEQLQQHLKSDFYQTTPVHRIFATAEEQNNWLLQSDSSKLADFLASGITHNQNEALNTPFELGEVLQTAKIDTKKLLHLYTDYLKQTDCFIEETFDYSKLEVQKSGISYSSIHAKKIVFAEGSRVVANPFFTVEALIPKKGEYITVESEALHLEQILKGAFFVIPLGNHRYKIGATFAHGDHTASTSETGRKQLQNALEKMISVPFKVTDQEFGFRPTVKDRRPLLGKLASDNLYFLNGLGTRGLLMAPLLSKWLYTYIENGAALPDEVDIARFRAN